MTVKSRMAATSRTLAEAQDQLGDLIQNSTPAISVFDMRKLVEGYEMVRDVRHSVLSRIQYLKEDE